jgi:hypothetical protein
LIFIVFIRLRKQAICHNEAGRRKPLNPQFNPVSAKGTP